MIPSEHKIRIFTISYSYQNSFKTTLETLFLSNILHFICTNFKLDSCIKSVVLYLFYSIWSYIYDHILESESGEELLLSNIEAGFVISYVIVAGIPNYNTNVKEF